MNKKWSWSEGRDYSYRFKSSLECNDYRMYVLSQSINLFFDEAVKYCENLPQNKDVEQKYNIDFDCTNDYHGVADEIIILENVPEEISKLMLKRAKKRLPLLMERYIIEDMRRKPKKQQIKI